MSGENRANGIRLLAVDEEYLIALDIQNILQEYEEFTVDVETLAKFEQALSSGTRYDLVIIDPGSMNLTRREIAEKIEVTGATLVWSSTEMPGEVPTDALGPFPVVSKPFSARELLEAVVVALAPVQPETARLLGALLSASGP